MIKWLKSRISMQATGNSFWDCVANRRVRYWVDCYEVEYMAYTKWGFRVKT